MMSKKKKSASQDKIDELEHKWKRALADYANLEKRIEKEKHHFIKFSNAQLLKKLLPILDDLELCENHLKDQGLTMILNKLKEILKSEGVEEIKTQDEEFNPEMMEAMEIIEGPKNKVIEVVSRGYLLGGKILRVAKVKVGGSQSKEVFKDVKNYRH